MSDDEQGAKPDEKWVELRRYNDPLEADMAKDFLEQSGVPVLVRGNSGVTGVLNRFDTILDIRLTVPESKMAIAREALEAMQQPARSEAPFRGAGPEKAATADDAPIPRKKSPFLAMGFALLVPIGGGHLYAGHQAAGKVLALYIIGLSLVALVNRPSAWAGVLLLIAIDALSAPFAVNRFNRDAVPTDKLQSAVAAMIGALVCVLLAFMQ